MWWRFLVATAFASLACGGVHSTSRSVPHLFRFDGRTRCDPKPNERVHQADSHADGCGQCSPIGQCAENVGASDRDEHPAQHRHHVWGHIEPWLNRARLDRHLRRHYCGPETLFEVQDALPQILNLKD